MKVRWQGKYPDGRGKIEEASINAERVSLLGSTLTFLDSEGSVQLMIPEAALIDTRDEASDA